MKHKTKKIRGDEGEEEDEDVTNLDEQDDSDESIFPGVLREVLFAMNINCRNSQHKF